MSFLFRRTYEGWPVAICLLLVALILGNVRLLLGMAAPQYDAVDFFGPQFALVGDQIRSGHLVKWDPWVAAGGPDLAEPELGSVSPVLIAASFLSLNPQEGYVAYWLAVWIFGGIGVLMLARHLRCPSYGGAIAALGFVASGFYTGHAEHMSSIYSVSFVPWVLWRVDAGLRNRKWWYGVQAGALYGLSALGGYPAYTIMTAGFLGLWALGRVVCRDSDEGSEPDRPKLKHVALILVLTIGVGAVILAPAYASIVRGTHGYSDHIGPRPREVAVTSNLLPAGALSTFASPYLALLNFPPNALWPATDVSMTSIYTGAATLVFALFGWRGRSPWRWWLVLLAAFFLCCALGSQLPLRGWMYDLLPPTRYFRNAALFRAYVILVLSILAALATRDLSNAAPSDADRLRLWVFAGLLACASGCCFYVVVHSTPKSFPEMQAGIIHLIWVWLSLAVLTYALKARRLSIPQFLRIAAVLAVVDATGSLYVSRPTLYTSGTLPWWHEMNTRHRSDVDLQALGLARDLHPPESLGSYPNNRNLLIKTAVFDSYITLWNRFQQQIVADPLLSRMAIGKERMWFSSEVARRAPDDASFRRFQERTHALAGVPILVVHTPEQMLAISPAGEPEPIREVSLQPLNVPPCIPAAVSDVKYTTDSLSFRYVAPSSGYLLVTDRWADGWDASVNGAARPVFGGNFIFRAIPVEEGSNVIDLHYNPKGFWPLVFLSWGSLLVITGVEVGRFRSARMHREQNAANESRLGASGA